MMARIDFPKNQRNFLARPIENGGVFMPKKTSLILAFVLLLATTAITHAADKCASLQASADSAWTKYAKADDDAAKALESLRLARERGTAAENAYAEATRAVTKTTTEWNAAVRQLYACLRLAKKTGSKCKIEAQGAKDAFEAMKHAEELQEKMAFEIGSSQFGIEDARAKLKDAQNAAKKARQEYLDALDAWGKCLQDLGPRMA
jgi:membrane-associated HD superfamily phosphohydrolase